MEIIGKVLGEVQTRSKKSTKATFSELRSRKRFEYLGLTFSKLQFCGPPGGLRIPKHALATHAKASTWGRGGPFAIVRCSLRGPAE